MAEFHVTITGGIERRDGSLDPLGAEDLDRAVAAVRAMLAPLPQREAEIMRTAYVAELAAHLPEGRSVASDAAARWRDIVDAAELAAHRAATRGEPDAVAVYVSVRSASHDAPSTRRLWPSSAIREAVRRDGPMTPMTAPPHARQTRADGSGVQHLRHDGDGHPRPKACPTAQ